MAINVSGVKYYVKQYYSGPDLTDARRLRWPSRLSLQRTYLGARASTSEARAISIATTVRENRRPPKAAPSAKSCRYVDRESLHSHCWHICRAYSAGIPLQAHLRWPENLSDTNAVNCTRSASSTQNIAVHAKVSVYLDGALRSAH